MFPRHVACAEFEFPRPCWAERVVLAQKLTLRVFSEMSDAVNSFGLNESERGRRAHINADGHGIILRN